MEDVADSSNILTVGQFPVRRQPAVDRGYFLVKYMKSGTSCSEQNWIQF